MTTTRQPYSTLNVRAVMSLALAALLVMLAFVAQPSSAHAASAPKGTYVAAGGTYTWGVKSSFRNYVTGPIAKGKYTASGKAKKLSNGTLRFTGASGSVKNGKGTVRYSGSARFTGHSGKLDLTVKAPKLVVNGSKGTMYATVSTKKTDGTWLYKNKQIKIATVTGLNYTTKGKTVTIKSSAKGVKLTAAGAKALGGFYTKGQVMDRLTVTVKKK